MNKERKITDHANIYHKWLSNMINKQKTVLNTKLMLKEMLHITKKEPSLNIQHAAIYKNHEKRDLFNPQLNTKIIARRLD